MNGRATSYAVEARGLTRRFGPAAALDGVDLAVRSGEFFSLLGPSGCGKTTLLRIVAGLDQPDTGTLQLDGTDALAIPAHRRPVNTVFQSYALFPHLNVFDNIAFGLRMKQLEKRAIGQRVQRMAETVQVTALLSRRPAALSGGEKQRVALARALVNEPRILLLDEPLGALDLKLRLELQQELRLIQRRSGITFIYVTHDQDEALSLSDRIAVLKAGRIEQVGSGEDLYERPRTRFVADFLGGCNLLPASGAPGEFVAQTAWGKLTLAVPCPEKRFTLAIRPEKIAFHVPADAPNQIEAVIADLTYKGSETHYLLQTGSVVLKATTLNQAGANHRLNRGTAITVSLPPDRLVLLRDE